MASKSKLFPTCLDKFPKRVVVISTVAGVFLLAGIGVLAYDSWMEHHKSNGDVTKAVAETDDWVEHLSENDVGSVCEIVSLTYQPGTKIGESVDSSMGVFELHTVSEEESEVCLEYTLKASEDAAYGDLPIISVCDSEGHSDICQSFIVTESGESDDASQTVKAGDTAVVRCRMDVSEYSAYELRMLLPDDKTVYLAGAN